MNKKSIELVFWIPSQHESKMKYYSISISMVITCTQAFQKHAKSPHPQIKFNLQSTKPRPHNNQIEYKIANNIQIVNWSQNPERKIHDNIIRKKKYTEI